MIVSNEQALVIGGALILLWFRYRDNIAEAVDKVNPASDGNLIYQGVSNAGEAATGDEDFSLGTWVYEQTHEPDTMEASE